MLEQSEVQLTGVSNQTYDFSVTDWGTSFYRFGSVYIILQKSGQSQFRLLYIGQTSDISERFYNHHKQACFDQNGKTHIGIYPESSESNRFAIETDLVRNYNPICND